MFEALMETGLRIATDRSVRAVVLSGEGKAFCAGLDWMAFLGMGSDAAARLLHREPGQPANVAQRACWVWAEMPVPVIAAVHGAAFGGGLQLALAADMRFVAPDAELSVMEIRYGLIPDMTASQTLLRLVRADIARELVYTGRVVTGEEAARIGLATRACVDPIAEAFECAREIASKSPHAIIAAKKLMSHAARSSAEESFLLETELQMALLGSPNQMEAVQAAMAKREGSFRDPE
jgi:enoyl-CoA hydratase/carnithine racemase